MKVMNFGEMPQVREQENGIEVITPETDYQFLDFETNKVQTLTLEQLAKTNMENRGDDRACPHGIYHYVMLEKILEMCEEHNYHAEVYDLFATNNKDKQTPGVSLYPELEARYGERAIQATTLRRVFANIRLTNFDDDELTTNIAVSYTQKGIQVGFGSMVKVCHNQNLMGRGQFVSDYSTHNQYAKDPYKTNLEGIFKAIGGWLTDAEHIVITDRETIEKMKKSVLTAEQLYMILGMLTAIRVSCDTQEKEIRYKGGVYPLNQTQICKFTESLLLEQKKVGCITAWTLYNAATELYKPATCEQNLIMPMNMAMMSFLRENEIF